MTRSLVLALAFAVPAAAADPKAVIEKAVAAHGGAAALDKYLSQKATVKGTITAQGMDIPIAGTFVRGYPDKEKQTATLNVGGMDVQLLQVTNGKAVGLTIGGQAPPLDDDRKTEARFSIYTSNLTRLTPLLAAGGGYTLKAGPEAAVGGNPAVSVVVEHADFKPVTLYFDKESGRLAKSVRPGKDQDGQDAERETAYADYKAVSGVQLPHTVTSTIGGKPLSKFTVEKYELAERVDAGEFVVD